MGISVVDGPKNKIRDSSDVLLAEKIIGMKSNKNPWEVIGELVDAWMKRTPEEFNAYKTYIEDTRRVQIDSKYGKTRNQDHDRRFMLVFPEPLMAMIRAVYKPADLPMDKEFFREFARRFPFFRIPEKI